MVHSFRTNSKYDKDIESTLLALNGKEKTAFIKEAIRFYVKYGETIKRMDDNISKMLNMLEQGCISVPAASEEQSDNEAEKILEDSIMSLL
ncbi:hypothetical protein SAMN02746089_02705 [Caldanaerobius fijiensis DSM 17918]|uniref:Uncharacterized protein n=1 Tax=Caldanaerobius fijiensis DSM 17918 TaxID=1121256 RepID=A0A1M5F8N9_9THEO|nr:hypothetical protein [Caldanaerobius fijiensis]SHF87846.1 hypothetical protein SAMN02746089_02705 [Caldanaerobius fijiensis DSM 17918]